MLIQSIFFSFAASNASQITGIINGIEQLTGSNFGTWKEKLEITLALVRHTRWKNHGLAINIIEIAKKIGAAYSVEKSYIRHCPWYLLVPTVCQSGPATSDHSSISAVTPC